MSTKYVFITGVEFNNQGAFLMLKAICDEVRGRFQAVPVVGFNVGSRDQRLKAGVATLVPLRIYRKLGRLGRRTNFSRLKRLSNYIFPSEIFAVFDASGFAFGDQWSSESMKLRLVSMEFWATHDVPVYLLPQALGPFNNSEDIARRLTRTAQLVMPRDMESKSNIENVDGISPNVISSSFPDFTTVLSGVYPAEHEGLRGHIPFVPNWQILSRANSENEKSAYIRNLAGMARRLHGLGFGVYGLSHEGLKDVDVLREVSESINGEFPFPIVYGLDGIQLKGLISGAPIVVAGRFHALVSALSQGIPAVMHGWSHKYQELALQFDCTGALSDPFGGLDEILEVLDTVLNDADLAARILAKSGAMKSETNLMWTELELSLRSGHPKLL